MTANKADEWLGQALEALAGEQWEDALHRLPVPVYTTDVEGAVTFWNRACIALAGREPQLGRDRWCVTWKIWTTVGDRLPHDSCPMAVAIKERRSVRGEVAIAERPDGSRVAFAAYPTPLFDAEGTMTGAVNMLVDVSNEQRAELLTQAERCRRLAATTDDARALRVLTDMAHSLDATSALLKR